MIRFVDFAPEITKQGFFSREFQQLEEALVRANAWIDSSKADVINVETVVLPEIWSEEGTTDPDLRTSGEMSSSWHQFIRVWYRE